MRKHFFEYSKNLNYYFTITNKQTINFDLLTIWQSFDNTNDWIEIDDDDNDWVIIWDTSNIKNKKRQQFISTQDQDIYNQAYAKYWRKRWAEIPKIEITKESYTKILESWNEALQNKKQYIIISIDDSDTVSIKSKDMLNEQDMQNIILEHQKFLNYYKKYNNYWPFKAYKKNPWESPNDDDFYSDFLTEEEMVWKKKKIE